MKTETKLMAGRYQPLTIDQIKNLWPGEILLPAVCSVNGVEIVLGVCLIDSCENGHYLPVLDGITQEMLGQPHLFAAVPLYDPFKAYLMQSDKLYKAIPSAEEIMNGAEHETLCIELIQAAIGYLCEQERNNFINTSNQLYAKG